MKKILIAGGSYGDIPTIKTAKINGFCVITSGNNKKELGHLYSDEYCPADYSDKDELLKISRSLGIDYIVPACHDLSMVSCAYVAEQLSLPGYDSYETTLRLHHKNMFRKLADEIGLKSPASYPLSSLDEVADLYGKISQKNIVKPIDSGGGRGITVIGTEEELLPAVRYAFENSKAGKVVVEEFVDGTLHSFSSFIRKQKVIFCYCDNEYSSVNKYGVATSSAPCQHSDRLTDSLIAETEKTAKYLNLSDGLLHLQYIFNGDQFKIIEFTRRMPGDWYFYPVNLSTGINYPYWYLQGFIGNEPDHLAPVKQQGFYSRHCLMAQKNGIIEETHIGREIEKNIVDKYVWARVGDLINNYMYQKLGLFFLQYESFAEMEDKTANINDLITIKILHASNKLNQQ